MNIKTNKSHLMTSFKIMCSLLLRKRFLYQIKLHIYEKNSFGFCVFLPASR